MSIPQTKIKSPFMMASELPLDSFVLALIAAGQTNFDDISGIEAEKLIEHCFDSREVDPNETRSIGEICHAIISLDEIWSKILADFYPFPLRPAIQLIFGIDPTLKYGSAINTDTTYSLAMFVHELALEKTGFAVNSDDEELNQILTDDDVHKFQALAADGSIGFGMRVFDGGGLLHVAVRSGSIRIVKWLIDAHFPLDFQDGTGDTALHDAAVDGFTDCFELLWNAGASNQIRNHNGCLPTDLILLSESVSFAEAVVASGRATALEMMSSPSVYLAIKRDCPTVILHYMSQGVNPWKKKLGFIHLAYYAIRNINKPEFVISMIKEGLIDKDATIGEMSLLQVAVFNRNNELLDFLLEAGADINLRTKKGHSALLFAVTQTYDHDLVAKLIAHGAECESDRILLLQKASAKGHLDLLQIMASRGENFSVLIGKSYSPLRNALIGESDEVFGWLLERTDISFQNLKKIPLCVTAIRHKRWRRLAMLLEKGAGASIPSGKIGFQTFPLHAAIAQENLEAVKLLLQYGALVNQPAALGASPGLTAKLGGSIESKAIYDYLKKQGAKVQSLNKLVKIVLILITWALLSWIIWLFLEANG